MTTEQLPTDGTERIKIQQDESDNLTIMTTSGLAINSLLPSGWTIKHQKLGQEVLPDKKILYLDIEMINKSGAYGLALLAHEIGHANDPDLYELYKKASISDETITEQPTEKERFGMIVDKMNAILKLEINADDYGKAVADELGLDEIFYEDFVNLALRFYEYNVINELYYMIEEHTPSYTTNNRLIGIKFLFYDINTGRDKYITFEEIKSLRENILQSDLYTKSMEEVERLLGVR